MSTLNTTFSETVRGVDHQLPIVSAADVDSRIEVEFDQHQGQMLKEEARQRALSTSKSPDRDLRNHLIGLSSEIAVATWQDGKIDRRIFDDFEGDGGVDVIASGKRNQGSVRFQVKATRKVSNPKRVVTLEEVDNADIFVLCRTTAPNRLVKIIGYVRRSRLEAMNTVYGRNGYVLRPNILHPVGEKYYGPDDVRKVVQD